MQVAELFVAVAAVAAEQRATAISAVARKVNGVAMNEEGPIRTKDFMTRKPLAFAPDMDLLDAARMLLDRRASGAPVVDALGNLVGMLTERDYLNAVLSATYHHDTGGSVGDYMTRDVQAVDAEESLMDVATRFVEHRYRSYPVVEKNRLVGMVSRHDVLRAMFGLV